MRPRLYAALVALLGSLSLAVPAAEAAPTFSTTSIDPVVFYTSPGSTCSSQPTNSVTLPTATGTGTISYDVGRLSRTGITLTGNTLSGDPKHLTFRSARTQTYTATDDEGTSELSFSFEIVDEPAMLQILYGHNGGATWTNKSGGWADPITATCLDDLHGVSIQAGRVSSLQLPNNNLQGGLPAILSKLTGLQVLDLSTNILVKIPDLSALTNLTTLNLDNNQLTGSIPTLPTGLTTLNLDNNQLTGSIPTLPTGLTALNLGNNRLHGPIPNLKTLTQLQSLSLFTNRLGLDANGQKITTPDLDSLLPPSLQLLSLNFNQLSGPLPDVSSLTNLVYFYIRDNELTGPLPDVSALTSLQQFSIRNNQLGADPDVANKRTVISGLVNKLPAASLTHLWLSNNGLQRKIPDLNRLTSLTHLWLSNNKLKGSIPKLPASLTHLELQDNQLTGTLPARLNNLNLTTLLLHNNKLEGSIPAFTGSLTGTSNNWLVLSLYGNAKLYGYHSDLNTRRFLYLLVPGDGTAVCLPTTQDGTDCTVPTQLDNLSVQARATALSLSWTPKHAAPLDPSVLNDPDNPPAPDDSTPVRYDVEYVPAGGYWSPIPSVTGTTARITGLTPGETYFFRVAVGYAGFNYPGSPQLYSSVTLPELPPTTLTLSALPALAEGGRAVPVTVTLDQPAPQGGTAVTLSTTGSTATAADYTLAPRRLTIAKGRTRATATLRVIDDSADDDSETIVLTATSTNPALTSASVTGTILDNDTTVSLTATPPLVTEGSAVTVTARLAAAVTRRVSIPIALTRVTAEADDFGAPASLTIASGATDGAAIISTNPDPDTADETFTVALGAPLPSVVTAGSPTAATVTILDDDGPAWAATLALKGLGASRLGCSNSQASLCRVTTTLSDAAFTFGPTTYSLEAVDYDPATSRLRLQFDRDVQTALDGLNLCVGQTALAFSSATHTQGNAWAEWSSTGVSWAAGATVSLKIGYGTACTLPPPPAGLTVMPGTGRLTLSWTAPPGAVTSYTVQYQEEAATPGTAVTNNAATGWVQTTGVTATTREITGLTNDMPYAVRVRTVNADGDGPWATGSGTPGTPPPPAGLTVMPGTGRLTLSWTAPPGTVTSYTVQYREEAATPGTAVTNNAATGWVETTGVTGPPQAITGLTNDMPYDVRVRAVTADGDSSWATGSGTPRTPPPPPQPPSTGGGTVTGGGGGGGGGGGSRSTPDQHGDTPDEATPLNPPRYTTGSLSRQLNARLQRLNDVDYFQVALPHAGVLTASTTGGDTTGRLYQAHDNGPPTLVAADAASGPFQLGVPVDPGVYYLAVSAGASFGDYRLRVDYTSASFGSPAPHSSQSGLGVLAGWVCDAETVTIELETAQGDLQTYEPATGTDRADTAAVCGADTTDTGFGLLYNWNLLGDGRHTVRAVINEVVFAERQITVTTLGQEYRRGLTATTAVADFPEAGQTTPLRWEEAGQNFVIARGDGGGAGAQLTPEQAWLGVPAPGSFQSGISVVSGWVCAAAEVVIEIETAQGETQTYEAGYGTERADTVDQCGDTDNGFGLLFNWNLLGDGQHTVRALADGEEFAHSVVTVTTLGEEFAQNLRQTHTIPDFPEAGQTTTVEWQEAQQNFVITAVE